MSTGTEVFVRRLYTHFLKVLDNYQHLSVSVLRLRSKNFTISRKSAIFDGRKSSKNKSSLFRFRLLRKPYRNYRNKQKVRHLSKMSKIYRNCQKLAVSVENSGKFLTFYSQMSKFSNLSIIYATFVIYASPVMMANVYIQKMHSKPS